MSQERDPRTDPRPGDVVDRPFWQDPREVLVIDGDRIQYKYPREVFSRWTTARLWRAWARNSTIIHKAES